MPKTQELPEKRIGRNVPRMVRAAREIVRESPDSESKDAMKQRVYNRQRITVGDTISLPRPRDIRKR